MKCCSPRLKLHICVFDEIISKFCKTSVCIIYLNKMSVSCSRMELVGWLIQQSDQRILLSTYFQQVQIQPPFFSTNS